jgi:hypothetical protein
MSVRAKFRCMSDTTMVNNQHTYRFVPVVDDGTPENERYHRYTPSGELTLVVDNPAVGFKVGECYYGEFYHDIREPVPA